ncbi:HAD family hydrolase [Actinophytocola xanthii]|uniref:Haloacid dehalogenase n=1 Tax=Actinophytocola xanthii TaxID=1912961 RepID=A0A1Q8CRU5_9PSEU|nr:HAD-IA family hydrolase [Actinophytocola xanthii]OLF17092.1 hypothetical protein BU204_13450 [Actinophytocola xanthii]
MIPPIDDPETLRRILVGTEAMLLDFDGPVCSVFAGFPAHVIAEQLRDVLVQGGHVDLPAAVKGAVDPFAVLFHAATLGEAEARYVEAAFRGLEANAIQSAKPTPGSNDLIYGWKQSGRSIAVVSNNSEHAVAAYLDIHNLGSVIDVVSARSSADVDLLKPNPFLVNQALVQLGIQSTRCIFVGDSVTDVQAARKAQVPAIYYANKPSKLALISNDGPTAITTSISLLGSLLYQ